MGAASWLVLGLGNPLADADGFGPAVIDALRAAPDLPRRVELVAVHTDLLNYIDRFLGRDAVVLVDAVLSPDASGMAVVDEETFSTWDERSTGAHGMSPIAVVKLYRRLYHPPDAPPFGQPRITLVAYRILETDFSRPLTPEVIRAGAEAVRAALARG
jgi:hydrogenase maturation protease